MATLYVSHFGAVESEVASRPLSSTTVTTSGTSAATSAASQGAVAALYSDTAHYVTTGSSPTATATNGFYLPASTLYWVKLQQDDKIAAITV